MNLEIIKGNNRFYIGKSEKNDIARITYYYKEDNVIVIDHTFVSPKLRGKSVAGNLLNKVIEFARVNNLLIIPVCSYAVLKMTRNTEYNDILLNKI